MIFDAHMHVGSFESVFGVSLDRDGIERLMREHMEDYVAQAKRRHPGLMHEVVDWR